VARVEVAHVELGAQHRVTLAKLTAARARASIAGMKKTHGITIAIALAAAGTANAGGKSGSVGVGAELDLQGIGGVSVNYDAGSFHVGGFLGYDRDRGLGGGMGGTDSVFVFGGRFFYHLHSTAMSDFSVGALVSLENAPNGFDNLQCNGPNNPRCNGVFIEPGFQLRAFITSNVALSFTGGIVIGTIDSARVLIGAQVDAVAGVHYYFF
jgi:hypothetical protein